MKSRMDKYGSKKEIKYERTKKNTQLYEDVYDDMYKDMSYKNMEVIDSAKEINLNKLKGILDDKYDTRQYRKLREYSLEDTGNYIIPTSYYNETKTHDINEIISHAKSKRAFIEEAKEKQKYMDFKERVAAEKKDFSSLNEEKELEELINTMAIPIKNENTSDELDMFSELKGEENTIVTNPIEVTFEAANEIKETKDIEKTLVRADKTFYTDSNMFTKNDFEDFSTLTREFIKTNSKRKFIIVILIVIILFVIAFFAYTKFMPK